MTRVKILEKKFDQLVEMMKNRQPSGGGGNDLDAEELKRLADLLAMLQNELNGLKNEVSNGFT